MVDLKETNILGTPIADHWYYRSKAEAMKRLLGSFAPSTILDIGAGSGFFSRYLLSHTAAACAWCVDINYEADFDSIEDGKPIRFRKSVEAVDADLVLLMDVLEHVEDDIGILVDYARKVPQGARFLMSVPAFRFLWSGHDKFLEHKRRYTLRQIEEVVKHAGLTVERGVYFFGLVFPIAAATRLAGRWLRSGNERPQSQLKKHNPIVNSTLTALCKAEMPMLSINRFVGLTVFCQARRP